MNASTAKPVQALQQQKLIVASSGLNNAVKRMQIYARYEAAGTKVSPAITNEAWRDAQHYAQMIAEIVKP